MYIYLYKCCFRDDVYYTITVYNTRYNISVCVFNIYYFLVPIICFLHIFAEEKKNCWLCIYIDVF